MIIFISVAVLSLDCKISPTILVKGSFPQPPLYFSTYVAQRGIHILNPCSGLGHESVTFSSSPFSPEMRISTSRADETLLWYHLSSTEKNNVV